MKKENNVFPIPNNDVNLVLQTLLDNVRTILGDYFIGMYLYGSLASGDFNPDRSDIDFLVVTRSELPGSMVVELKSMHARLYHSGTEWSKRLEGSYIPLDTVRKYSLNGSAWPMTNKGKFLVAHENIVWVINSYILYTSGLVIIGPPLQTIIDPVGTEELKDAVLTLLRDVWQPWQNNSDLFLNDEYQPFVVLTMCRSLYTLKHGTVVSKRCSAEWVVANSDTKWTKLIERAMAWNYGDPPGNIAQTQEFIRYTIKEAGLRKED